MWNDDWFREMERLRRLVQDRNPFKELQEAQRRREELGLNDSSLERIGMDADRLSAVAKAAGLQAAARLQAEPSLQQFAKDMDRIREQTKAIFGSLNLVALDIQQQILAKSGLLGSLAEMSDRIRLQVGDLSAIQGNFGQLAELSRNPVLGNIQTNFDYFIKNTELDEAIERFKEFNQSFASEYVHLVARISIADDEEKPRIIDEFFETVNRLWEKMNKTRPMVLFVLGLLFSFMLYHDAGIQDKKRYGEQKKYFDNKFEEFYEYAAGCERDTEEEEREEYTIKEQTQVFDIPDTESEALIILDKHMGVYLLEIQGDWYYVNYVDQIKAVEGIGWIHKDAVVKNIEE